MKNLINFLIVLRCKLKVVLSSVIIINDMIDYFGDCKASCAVDSHKSSQHLIINVLYKALKLFQIIENMKGGKTKSKKEILEDLNEDNSKLDANLRDIYIRFNDLAEQASNASSNSKQNVFAYIDSSIFLQHPDEQSKIRAQLIKRMEAIQSPYPLQMLGETLREEYIHAISNQSSPSIIKGKLCSFYKRKLLNLQSKQHIIKRRWIYFSLNDALFEKHSFMLHHEQGRIQKELDITMERIRRLSMEDDLENPCRPVSVNNQNLPLYIKQEDFIESSNIRRDDIEVYLRYHAYYDSVSDKITNFCTHIQWITYTDRYALLENSRKYMYELRAEYLKKQRYIYYLAIN